MKSTFDQNRIADLITGYFSGIEFHVSLRVENKPCISLEYHGFKDEQTVSEELRKLIPGLQIEGIARLG